MRAMILAGGKGRRLQPYTTVLPKPLMPLGEKTILEHIILQLVKCGIIDISISVGYLAGLIEAYFGDGSSFGANITYLHENIPLGTAGPVRLFDHKGESFLVLNGDVLTDLNFSEFERHHKNQAQLLTVASYQKAVEIDLGVLNIDENSQIFNYSEKPVLNHDVSMGVYCCSPGIVDFIPEERAFNLPDLVEVLLRKKQRVGAYQHQGYWMDIGRHCDYEFAQNNLEKFIK